MFKKAISMILSVMMLVSVFSVTSISASAAEDSICYVVAGTANLCDETWSFTEESGNIMTQKEDGTYELVFSPTQALGIVQIKVAKLTNGDVASDDDYYGDATGNNITFEVFDAGDITVIFDPETKEVSVKGDNINLITDLKIDSMRAVGGGDGAWLNGSNWDPADDSNLMTEVSKGIYEITYTDVEEFDNYMVKFAANGSWTDNWGGTFIASDVETDADYNGGNIIVEVPYELADVTLRLDLTGFDYATKTGAKFTVIIKDANEVPTEPITEPTTAPATEPTTAPATDPDVPSDGYYVYGDNLKLKLTTCGINKVSATLALQAGTYTFKLDNNGTLLGYGKKFTDSTNGMTFSTKYKSSATLIASGGTYTFQVNTDTNTLVVKYNNALPNEYLTGDLNTILTPVEGKTLSVGSTYLEAGTYKFKLSIGAKAYGYNKTITNTTNGSSLSFNSKYSSSVTLIATGGTYTFTLNTATNRLIVGYVAARDERTDDVHISGDFDLVLDDNGGDSNIAVGTTTLAEGTYSFKVYNYGTGYTIGERIVDNGKKMLKSSLIKNLTLIASGGTYTFEFNKTTGQLIVTKG